MRPLRGIMPALLTPFDTEGRLDEDGLVRLTDFVIRNGSEGLYVNGSTGESFLCDVSVRERILSTAAEAADGRVPLIAQVGSLVAEESRKLIETAGRLGYDYISAVTPFYYRFSFEEVLAYYRRLTEAGMPLVIYMIPALTGLNLDMTQIERLFDLPNIAGMKFTSGDIFLLERLRKRFPDKVLLFGYDEMLLSGAMLGSDGAIGSTFNITSPLANRIWRAVAEGRTEDARTAQTMLNDFISVGLEAGLYPFLKEVLRLWGVPAGVCRPPFAPLSDEGRRRAEEARESLRSWGVAEP